MLAFRNTYTTLIGQDLNNTNLMKKLLLLHGPNLNLLGERETPIYGARTLAEIDQAAASQSDAAGVKLTSLQSNSESDLINVIHQAKKDDVSMIVFNPAAFTHTSVALRDALLAAELPFIEVHLSNPASREPFRHHSFFSDIAIGVVSGFGARSYQLAVQAAIGWLDSDSTSE